MRQRPKGLPRKRGGTGDYKGAALISQKQHPDIKKGKRNVSVLIIISFFGSERIKLPS